MPSEIIVDTLILLIHSPQESSIHNKQYELADIISELDKREDVDSQKIIQIEFLFYRLLERYGKAYDIKLINEIMSNPDSMMEIIKMVYLPSDEKRKATELNELTHSPNL